MKDQEKIICPAVKFNRAYEDDTDRKLENIVLCVNYHDNFHEDALFKYENNAYIYIESTTYGFMTSKNRFVDAQTAKRIAIDAKQFPYPYDHYMGGYVTPLKPEDLY